MAPQRVALARGLLLTPCLLDGTSQTWFADIGDSHSMCLACDYGVAAHCLGHVPDLRSSNFVKLFVICRSICDSVPAASRPCSETYRTVVTQVARAL